VGSKEWQFECILSQIKFNISPESSKGHNLKETRFYKHRQQKFKLGVVGYAHENHSLKIAVPLPVFSGQRYNLLFLSISRKCPSIFLQG
jgi:hypothetical protein